MSNRPREPFILCLEGFPFRNKNEDDDMDDENDDRSQYLCVDQPSGAVIKFMGIINLGERI